MSDDSHFLNQPASVLSPLLTSLSRPLPSLPRLFNEVRATPQLVFDQIAITVPVPAGIEAIRALLTPFKVAYSVEVPVLVMAPSWVVP